MPEAVKTFALTWAVLHLETRRAEGWYRDETDAQEVLEFLRDEFKSEHFVLIKELSPDRRQQMPQFNVTVDGRGKWKLEPRISRFSTD